MTSLRSRGYLIALLLSSLASWLWLGTKTSQAAVRELPTDLVKEVLSESVPTAFEVFPLSAKDIKVSWVKDAPAGVQMQVIPGSIQWVRVAQALVVPRGRLRVLAPGWEAVALRSGLGVEAAQSGKALEFAVPLFSGDWPSLELRLRKGSKVENYPFTLRYSPASPASSGSRVFADSSCSPYSMEVLGGDRMPPGQWAYLSCRIVRTRQGSAELPSFEVYLHWDGVQGPLLINGIPTPSTTPGIWLIRLGSERPSVELADEAGTRLELRFQIPQKLTFASLGLGVGPYSYYFEDGVSAVERMLPIATVYGSYFLTETSRMVFFDAFAPGSRWYNDFGLYFSNESSRALDDRLSVNILLGFHVIGFKASTSVAYRLGVPQGFEMIFRDAFYRKANLNAGGFFYPPIAGKSYYNAWIRYGTSKIFGEINFIAWSELGPQDEKVYSRSLGFTIGAPLFLFR